MTRFNSINAKLVAAGTWVIHSEQILASPATTVTISNLNGDVDGDYRVIVRGIANATDTDFRAKINNDGTSSIYGYQQLYGISSSGSAGRATASSLLFDNGASSGHVVFSDMFLSVKSGVIRTALSRSIGRVTGTTVGVIRTKAESYNETATNVTSLVVSASQTNGLGAGTYILVLKRVESTTMAGAFNSVRTYTGQIFGDVFETVKESVLTQAATSITLSGLDGNTDILYELDLCAVGGNGAANIWLYPNNDNAYSRFGYQRVGGVNGAFSAARKTASDGDTNGHYLRAFAGTGSVEVTKALIFAKSGYLRTMLVQNAESISGSTVNANQVVGHVWTNTSDNLTSLILSSGTNAFGAGTYYRLKTLKRKV